MTAARAGRYRAPADSRAAVARVPTIPSGRVMERGRSKAYRPLAPELRLAAVERGLAAYTRGAWYLAHEELEPAWMGTDDPAERALLSGLIKLAAAYVHAARGNPLGVQTNLRGARERLRTAASGAAVVPDPAASGAAVVPDPAAALARIDLPALLTGLDDRVVRIEALCRGAAGSRVGAPGDLPAAPTAPDRTETSPPSHDVAGPVGQFRGAPVAIPLLPLPRKPA